jgi:phosphatidylinositol alpha-mannosyltransferase
MPYSPLFAGRVVDAAPARTKLIGTFHIVPANWVHAVGARALEIMNRRTLKQFDHIICVSPIAAEFAKSVFGIGSIVIPNALDESKFRRDPIKNKTLKIVFLGRLVERKGVQYLLKALLQLQKQYKGKYEVVIGGRGPLDKKLKAYALKNKLKNVKFIGFVEEDSKPELLASADIAVFPSTGGESFGISLIEAMAAGSRVVLGGDNAGYRGVLGDHPDLLINPKDAIGFANRLQYFLEHDDMRQAAYNWAQANIKQYDIASVGKKIVSVYKKD